MIIKGGDGWWLGLVDNLYHLRTFNAYFGKYRALNLVSKGTTYETGFGTTIAITHCAIDVNNINVSL